MIQMVSAMKLQEQVVTLLLAMQKTSQRLVLLLVSTGMAGNLTIQITGQ